MVRLKIAISLLVLMLCGCAYTKKDKQLITALWIVCAADYYQTNRILEDDDFEEVNGMIHDDTDAAVVLIGVPLALTLGYKAMPKKYRANILKAFIGVKGAAVLHNYKTGVR